MTDDTAHTDIGGGWEAPDRDLAPAASEALIVDVDGFEGPLDLLLALARTHKVDIAKISIVALVDQYIAYIGEAQRLKIEIAADYLVMAAWLTFLKSRLILPREKDAPDEVSPDEMARRLTFRLLRLEAMRKAMAELMTRHRLGRDVFQRGMPEQAQTVSEVRYTAEIFDLLKAYSELRRRTVKVTHVVKARRVWSIKQARQQLELFVGVKLGEWVDLDDCLKKYLPTEADDKTVVASSFGATLEMAREGVVELKQDEPFAPLYIRKREAGAEWQRVDIIEAGGA
ncbi:MAG: segregation/condensation protein A [Hyphomicrobium sp.]|jgi:segregation and condensation protein A|uniref:segregation and condensation protein A n=1 Tax=Hyphomicrobium sp. TaxID=82 RepID=UPI0025BCBC56|nr:ScpA family protein [Hyphomicrobium sp.]MBX9862572.1 segregation/condensation protein A [Hyphomicrobium sp.]